METWLTVPGDTIADLMAGTNNLVNTPNQKLLLSGSSLLEVPPNADGSWGEEYYGVRISGWLVPETTGTYKFWIAADDVGELWLSTNGNPVNKELICQCSTFVGFREWDIDPEQASTDIALVAGQAYYYEVRIHYSSRLLVLLLLPSGGGVHRQYQFDSLVFSAIISCHIPLMYNLLHYLSFSRPS